MRTSGRGPEEPAVDEQRAEPAGSGDEAGLPAPCPACDGRGFLDQIDLARRVQHEHCTACGARWSRPI
jgi:hypothetical protein